MNTSVCCCLSLLLLLHVVEGSPVSDLQSLKQLLEEEPYLSPVQVEAGGRDGDPDRSVFGGSAAASWDSSDPGNSALSADKDSLLSRLLKDLVRTSKRSWSRYKKGGMRSCFGVRLDRIGSFSGLGC